MKIDGLIMNARQMGCSDIHISVGMPLMFRINGSLQKIDAALTDGDILTMLVELISDEEREKFRYLQP